MTEQISQDMSSAEVDRIIINTAQRVFQEDFALEDINSEDIPLVNSLDDPSFPIIMVQFALFKDILDSLDLTLIGTVFTFFLSILFYIIMLFWTQNRLSGRLWKGLAIKFLWKKLFWKKFTIRFITICVLEIIPFVKIVPACTILVLMAHYHEKKIVRLFNQFLEELERLGLVRYIKSQNKGIVSKLKQLSM